MAIASRLAKAEPALFDKVQRSTSALLKTMADKGHNPPYIATVLFRNAYKVLKTRDPYLSLKNEYNRKVLSLYKYVKPLLKKSKNTLEFSIKLALAGNIIDFGILENFDLKKTLVETLKISIPLKKMIEITNRIKFSEIILYIADNAGEIGFDYFLLKEIWKLNPKAKLYLSVKKTPIINDATSEDASFFKLQKFAKIIDTGDSWIGTHPQFCSDKFKRIFAGAGLIISKGQANYESLDELNDPRILFLLKAKCPVVSRNLRVKLNDVVVK